MGESRTYLNPRRLLMKIQQQLHLFLRHFLPGIIHQKMKAGFNQIARD